MSFREQLHGYIAQIEHRLRWSTILRGIAVITGGALVATLVLVTIANARAFSNGSVTAARFALILILAVAAGAGLALPLRRLTRRRAVEEAEAAFPQFEQRLTTFAERDANDPFIELLAGDTLDVARHAEPEQLVTERRLWVSLAAGAGAFAALIWIITAGPGFIGYGASLLWTGPHKDKPAIYNLRVTPGDAVVRRHADQLISAIPVGLRSPAVKLHALFKSSGKWEEIAMQPKGAGSFAGGYQFLFGDLPDNVEYYVTAGAMTSKHFNIRVTDLPAVRQIRVTYHYPEWTGMPPEIEERGGDLRAVLGTEAQLEVVTDRPLNGGQIQLDGSQAIPVTPAGTNTYRATVKMDHDGVYHVAGLEAGQNVRVSEDFFIEARKPNPPQIALVRPGRGDYHASPIEEVTLTAQATGEYPLKSAELHYSVNGGPETTVDLATKKGAKEAKGSTTISLEDFKLSPGDLVSVYAMTKDANAEARTDMIFIQADPFERQFSQSQQSGGGGGGGGGNMGGDNEQISQREKEIISSTFRQQGDKNSTKQQAAEISRLLSESQAKLRDQSLTLSGRLEARELTDEMHAIGDFQKDMISASEAMGPAAQALHDEKWKDAIPSEQKALQFLLRAEATFRQIEIAFGGGGGGGGGGGAARDLAALFDLELDTEKNQYETQKSPASSEEQKAKEVDEALKKLDELARREQDLANQQRNGQQTAEQKWQQEMLQRDAEQLQKQLEQQVAQNGQPGQSQSGQQGSQQGQQQGSQQGSQSGSQSGQSSSGQSGSQSGSMSASNGSSGGGQQSAGDAATRRQQAAEQALERLRQANDDMKRAASGNASSADARRAADRLRQATDALGGLQQQDAGGKLGAMSQEAGQIADRQKQQADWVRNLVKEAQAAAAAHQQPKNPSSADVDNLLNGRQKATDDLGHLTQQMRDAARELATTQPGASSKLRSAIEALDNNDLNTRMQRSSDWLRSDQFSDQAETAITSDLQKLSQQIGDAARALGAAQSGTQEEALNRAMDDLSRLRDQLDGLGSRPGNSQAGQGQNGQGRNGQQQGPAGQGFQSGQLSRDGDGQQSGQQSGGQQGRNQSGAGQQRGGSQPGGGQQGGGQQGGAPAGASQANGGQAGGVGNRIAGPVGNPGGGNGNRNSTLNGGWDTGNTRIQGQAVAPGQGPNPADAQRDIDQGVNLLNAMRPAVQDSPEARQELQKLIEQMRNLDPSRFPGNPGLVEQMHQQLVSEVDALELQLRRQLDDSKGGTIRNPDPSKIPAGYQQSVAEYYRKLSTANHQ